MASNAKDTKVDIVAGQPVERDPQVEPTLAEASPTKVSTRRAITDSDPLSENEWMGKSVERPYGEAISPEHRAYLESIGVPLDTVTE